MEKHEEEIYNKPKKTWFISEKKKSQIRNESKRIALGEEEGEEKGNLKHNLKKHKRIDKKWKKS